MSRFHVPLLTAAAFVSFSAGSSAVGAPVLVDPGPAGLTTVTFDSPTLLDGTIITNQYSSYGLNVSGSEELFASHAYSTTGASGAHGASFDSQSPQNTGSTTGTWDFIFGGPVQFAGAYFEFNVGTSATFQALLAGVVVDSYIYTNLNCCTSPEFVGLSGISFDTLRLTNVTGSDFYIDDLRFSNVAAVPEPATRAMMLLGFGVVGFAMRRRNHIPQLA